MEKLNLKLFSNDKEVLSGESSYKIVNNKYVFKIDDSNYFLDINNKILEKNNGDTKIIIDLENKIIKVQLINHPGEINIELLDELIEFNDKFIKIQYLYNLEEEINNVLEINLY